MNPFYTLIPDDKIALSDINGSITYRELIDQAIQKRDWMVEMGYKRGHRIGISGKNDIRTYVYFLAGQMLSSVVGLRPKGEEENDWAYKIPASNLNVTIELGNSEEEVNVQHYHFDQTTECDKEYAVYFSSGTTSNTWGVPQSTPMVWDVDDHNWGMGIDIVNYNRMVINPYYRENNTIRRDDDNIQIQPMWSWIGWGQECTTLNLIKHGHTVLVGDISEWDTLVERHKPTWTVMFPMIAFKLMDHNKGGGHPIKCVEMSGARVTEKQLTQMKEFFNCDYFVSHYGTSQSGNFMHNSGDGSNLQNIGKPCEGFVHAYGEDFVRIGQNGTLEVKWHGSPPHYCNENGYYDTNDVVEMGPDGNYIFKGRANEMLMIRGGSKLLAPTIEDRMLEEFRVKEAYIFPVPESDLENPDIEMSREEIDDGILYQIPGLLYYGDISIKDLQEHIDKVLPSYHKPVLIYRLKDTLSSFTDTGHWKVRRLSMHDTLRKNHEEWCHSYDINKLRRN
jgi:acyl-coenzyme A synthetase/AMP-(fatty) acid ligase